MLFFSEKSAKRLASNSEQGPHLNFMPREDSLPEFVERSGKEAPEAGFRLIIRGMGGENRSPPEFCAFLAEHGFPKPPGVGLPGGPFCRLFVKFSGNKLRADPRGQSSDECLIPIALGAAPSMIHMEKDDLRPHSPAIFREEQSKRG